MTVSLQDLALDVLLPHSGAMCLLESVQQFDETSIDCMAVSHTDPANPLRHAGQLPVQAGIEYAAQAVAVHGGLMSRRSGVSSIPRGGMIAVLTSVNWMTDRLDNIETALNIHAEKIAEMPDGLCYRFAVVAAEKTLIDGELIVALQPSGVAE